jgi:hypothetical protein
LPYWTENLSLEKSSATPPAAMGKEKSWALGAKQNIVSGYIETVCLRCLN